MIRTSSAAVLFATLAACASAGTRQPGTEPAERTVTMVTTTNAAGQTTTTPVTTYADVGMRPVEIHGTADNVFRVLPEAYRTLGMEVVTSDPPNRTAGNTQIRVRRNLGRQALSTYLDCGTSGLSGPAADAFPIRLSVVSTVTPSGTTSQLRTVVRAAYVTAEQSGTTPCNTTGALESAIARAVQLQLVRT
jgi:type IV pilus biogenesis protein CpaD/CtpE